jgi:hypothetical protein
VLEVLDVQRWTRNNRAPMDRGVTMRAVVVYESMYGNTRAVAEAVAAGMEPYALVSVLPVAEAGPDADALRNVDLLVAGGPTHVRGMSRPTSRRSAVEAAAKPGSDLHLEPGADGPGLREWLEHMPCIPSRVAAFDTRMHAPAGVSGSAARRIARRLRRQGFEPAARPEGFYVTKENRLLDGELARARAWGAGLAAAWSRQPV